MPPLEGSLANIQWNETTQHEDEDPYSQDVQGWMITAGVLSMDLSDGTDEWMRVVPLHRITFLEISRR